MKRATLRAKTAKFEAKINEIEARIDQLRARTEKLEAKIEDEFRFIRSWLESPRITGAVSPSGRFLARAMARLVDPRLEGPVVELGPGTGVVTQALVDRGVAPQRLVLVEFNRDFIPLLTRRFPGARVLRGDAYAVRALLGGKLEAPASAIVSSLPLAMQPVERRTALLEDCFALLRPEGAFVQFSYMINPPIPVEAVGCRISGTPRIWWNLPPARVWCYRAMPQPISARRHGRAS
jgi:phosphatidylethanolamine/phosphatidyl-N-methylethanolamine N-methyltransferase